MRNPPPATNEPARDGSGSEKPKRRWLKRLGVGAVVVVALVMVVAFAAEWWVGGKRAAVLERMDALGVPSSVGGSASGPGVAGLDASVKTFGDWVAEAKALQPADEVVDRLPARGTVYALEPRMQLPGPMVEALEAMRPAVAVLLEGAEAGAPWFANRVEIGAFDEMEQVLSLSGDARMAARVLYEEMWRAMAAGDAAAVERAALGIEAIAASLRGGLLVEALVEMSIRAMLADGFEQVLSRGELPAEVLLRTASRLDAWAETMSPTDLLAGELAYTRSIVESGGVYLEDMYDRMVAEGKAAPRSGLGRTVQSVTSTLFPDVKIWGLVWSAEGVLATYESAVAAEAMGRPALLDWAQEKAGEGERLSGDALRTPVKVLAISADQLKVAAAALRVEAYRLAHGGWPSDLAMAHGGTTPLDWAGRPLVYRVQGGNAVVYGVGLNGVDNGGLDRRLDEDAPASADDTTAFWLYAPETRGALAAPAAGAWRD